MGEIIESDGDIFESSCEALVNPVDCTGAQGAGLALAFMRRFTKQCSWYERHGRRGLTEAGQIYHVLPKTGDDRLEAARWVLDRHRAGGEPLVLFATTKAHWKKPSRLAWVTGCLSELARTVDELDIRSLAIPALGCGLGDLSWSDVRPLILAAAKRMPCERVVVYGPKEPRRARR